MTRDRVAGIVVKFAIVNILVLTWALVSPVLAALGLAALGWAWGAVLWVAFRGTERDLYRCRLELATIRPDEREQAALRLASQQEIARRAAIIKREGAHFPEQDYGAALPDGYGFITWPR